MLQYGVLALAVICGTTSAAYSSSTGAGAGAGAGSFAGTYQNGVNGGGANGVYGNTLNGGGGAFGGTYGNKFPYPNNGAFFGAGGFSGQQQQPPFPQQFPFVQPPFQTGPDFQQFAQFWNHFGQNFQNLYNQQLAHQAQLFSQFGAGGAGAAAGGGAYGGGFGGNFAGANPNGFYAPNFAGSAASYGPGAGFQQSATIIPANPNSPNVDTRFGGDDPIVTVSAGPQGFKGVSTSSFSSSSDINGQKTNHREASTSVNDNGKVTTYTVRS